MTIVQCHLTFFYVRKTDAFYESLAAQAKAAGPSDNLSDVSDADPKDLLQNIVTSIINSLCLYFRTFKNDFFT